MTIHMLGIELTNRCNYTCMHCLRADIAPRKDLPEEVQEAIGPKNARRDVSIDIIDKIIREAAPLHIPVASFTGGEPTMHPEFEQICDRFVAAGYKLALVSNGSRWAKLLPIFERHRAALQGVCFSLDGANEATMDKLRQPGAYRTVMSAVSLMRLRRLPFSLQFVICQDNIGELEQMAELASRVGAGMLYFVPVQPTLQTTYKRVNLSPDTLYEVKKRLERIKATFKVQTDYFGPGLPQVSSPFGHCNALTMNAIYTDYLGNVTFCCQLNEYADSQVTTDVIANLETENLLDAVSRYTTRVMEYHKTKADLLAKGALSKLEKDFACWYCFKHFKKVEFLRHFPDDPWGADLCRDGVSPPKKLAIAG